MAQFNVDSEVIAAKSAQARSYVASITADVTWGDPHPCTIAELLDRLRIRQLQGVLGPVARKPAPGRASITQINEALTRAGVNYADTEQANAHVRLCKGQVQKLTHRQAGTPGDLKIPAARYTAATLARRRRTSIENPAASSKVRMRAGFYCTGNLCAQEPIP